MYPPLLGLFPDIGRSLLTYRVQRIPEAKLKALSYDPPYAGGSLGDQLEPPPAYYAFSTLYLVSAAHLSLTLP